jgi:hypothetical protein
MSCQLYQGKTMYKLEVKKAPGSDSSIEEITFILEDLVSAIDINLPEGSKVSRAGNIFSIETTLGEKELKKSMKPAFSYHFEDVRFVSVSKGLNF